MPFYINKVLKVAIFIIPIGIYISTIVMEMEILR